MIVIELVFIRAADDGCGRGVKHTKHLNNSGIGLTLPLLLTKQFLARKTDTSLTQWQLITAKVLYNPSYMKTLIKERRNLRVHTNTHTHTRQPAPQRYVVHCCKAAAAKMQREKRPQRNYFSLN